MKLRTVVAFQLTTLETFILAAFLTAAQGVQMNIPMSTAAHSALAIAILLVASAVKPLAPGQFLASLPLEIVYLLQAGLGALLIVQANFAVSPVIHTVIAVVIVAAAALGIGPASAPPISLTALTAEPPKLPAK